MTGDIIAELDQAQSALKSAAEVAGAFRRQLRANGFTRREARKLSRGWLVGVVIIPLLPKNEGGGLLRVLGLDQ